MTTGRTMDPERRRPWLVLLLLAVIAGAGLDAHYRTEATLTVAIHRGVESEALGALANDFAQKKHIPVELVDLPYDELYEAEMNEVSGAARHRFDVILLDDPWLPALIGRKGNGRSGPAAGAPRLHRVFESAEDCRKASIDDFVASTLRVGLHPGDRKAQQSDLRLSCDDTFYALPLIGNAQLFLARRLSVPVKWEDLARELRDGRGAELEYEFPAGAGNDIVTGFMPLLWSVMDEHRDEQPAANTRRDVDLLNLDDERSLTAFELVALLGGRNGAHRSVVSADDFDLTIHMIRHQSSMGIWWATWAMALGKLPEPYRQRLMPSGRDAAAGDRMAVMSLPGSGHEHTLDAWLLAIPARTGRADRQRAQEFVSYVTGQGALTAAALQGSPPPRRSVFADPHFQEAFPWFKEQLSALETARARQRTPFWRRIEFVVGECLSDLYDGATDERTALARLKAGLAPIRDALQAEDDERVRALIDAPMTPFTCLPSAADGPPAHLDAPAGQAF